MNNIPADEFVPAQSPEQSAPDSGASIIPYASPAPRATSVAGPIPDPVTTQDFMSSDEFVPTANQSNESTPAFFPPSVANSSFKDGVMSHLNSEPSDQGFDDAVRLNMGDLKWPLTAFKGIRPEVAAEVDALAKSNGLTYGQAASSKEDLQVLEQAKGIYSSLSATGSNGKFVYPNTVKWLQDPSNLAKTKDDVTALTNIEATVKAQQQAGESSLFQTARSARAGIMQDVSAPLLRIPGEAYSIGWDLLNQAGNEPTLNNLTGGNLHELSNLLPSDPPEWLSTLFGATNAIDKYANAISGSTIDGRTFGSDLSKGDVKGALQTGTVAFASFIPTIATSILNPALGISIGAGASGSSQYQADLAAGKSTESAEADAILNAGVNVVGLKAGGAVSQLERMKSLFAQPVVNETASQLVGRITKQSFMGATQGSVVQSAMQAGDDAADYATGNKDAFKDEMQKLVSAALLGFVADGALAGPLGAIEGIRQIKQQQAGQAAMENLTSAVSQSKLTARDPDGQAQFLDQNLQAAGAPKTVGVDAEKLTTFFQGRTIGEFNKFASDMGLKPEDITNAAATGGAVDLPISQYIPKYAGSDLDTAINQDLRFTPGGLSANETQAVAEQVQATAAQIKAELEKTATTTDKLPDRIATMRDTLMRSKEEGGAGYTADQADSQLSVLMAGLRQIAGQRGESVNDAVNRLGLGLNVGDISHDGDGNLAVRKQEGVDNAGTQNERVFHDEAGNRTSSEEDARGAANGSPKSGANLLERSTGASAEELGDYSTRERQAEAYRKVAEQTGKILPDDFLKGADPLGVGGEHEVFKKGNRVYKVTQDNEAFDYGTGSGLDYQTTPHQYLNRFALSNKIFGDDVKWEGVIPKDGHNRTVTSQDFFSGKEPSEAEFSKSLKDLGFEYHEAPSKFAGQPADKIWYRPSDGVILGDAKPANFVKTPDGFIRPVDVIAEQSTAAQRAKYGLPEIRHQDARGAITFGNGKTIIHLLKTADLSTFLHESGHLLFHEMKSLVDQGIANDQTKADLQSLHDFAGVKPGEPLTVDGEEKIVKAFESYLRDGKAPSIDLAGPFSRFRTWLSNIYRSVTALGTQPTDDIKQVFDRILASEDDIAHAQEYYSRKGDVLNLIKADEAEREEVRTKLAKVQQSELDKQTAAYLKSYLKAIGGVSAVRDAAKEAVEKQPVYEALETAKSGKIDEASIRQALGSKGLAEFEKKFPNLVKENGEHSLETLALRHGFESPETLADNLIAAVPKAEAVKNYTQRLVAEKEQQLRQEITKQGATPADGVMHTDASLAYLIAETNLMAKQLNKGNPVKLQSVVYRDAAKQAINDMAVRKAVRYSDFAKTEARLGKQVLDLAKKGKWDEALEARKKQIAQHAMVQEAIKARDERADIVRRYSPTKLESKLKNVDNEYIDPVRQILSAYGLSDTKPSEPYDLHNLADMDTVMASQIPTWLMNGENAGDYRDLTWGKLQDVDHAAQSILSFGNDQRKSDLAIEQKTIKDIVAKSVENINALPARDVRQLGDSAIGNAITHGLQKLDWLKSHVTKAIFLFKHLDNFSEERQGYAGVLSKMFHGTSGAEHDQSEAQREVYKAAYPHLRVLVNAANRLRKTEGEYFSIPGVKKPEIYLDKGRQNWSPDELVAYMLNTGAKGNLVALKNAFGHGPEEIQRVASRFTAEELHAVDGLRGSIDTLFDGLNDTNFKLYNRRVEKVDAVPMKFTSHDGQQVELKGGYWPLVFDYEINKLRGKYSEQDVIDGQIKAFLGSSKPEDGFTKSRVTGHSLAPRLDMGVFADHVDNTTRFIHMAPIIRDLSRVMQSPRWRDAVINKVGSNEYKQAFDWLKYQANPGRKQSTDLMRGVDKVADYARSAATANALGLNFVAGLKWRTSMLNSAVALGGWRHIANGYAGIGTKGLGTSTLGLNNTATWKMIESKSKLLSSREAKGIRDLRDDVEKFKWNQSEF